MSNQHMVPANYKWRKRKKPRVNLGKPSRKPEHRRIVAKAYADSHRADGLCTRCPDGAEEGKTLCTKHLKAKRKSDERRRRRLGIPAFQPAKLVTTWEERIRLAGLKAKSEKAYQDRKKAKGICVVCTEPVEAGRTKCKSHLALARENTRVWREGLKEDTL